MAFGRGLRKTTAAKSRRYDGNATFNRKHLKIHPAQTHPRNLDGWIRYTHPEGKPYYYHEERGLLTEANVENPDIAQLVNDCYESFQESAGETSLQSSEVVFELDNDGGCSYYIVDHDERREWWLDSTDTEDLGMEMPYNEQHLGLQLLEHYWIHCEFFPMHRSLPADAEDHLVALLCHATADQLTSEESTAPYTASECERLVNVIKNFRGDSGEKRWTIARIYRVFAHSQFINFHGQAGARLARSQSILDDVIERPSPVLAGLSRVLLFNLPQRHVKALQTLWVDRVVYIEHWQKYIQRLEREWTQSVALSGLFLSLAVIIMAGDPHSEDKTHFAIALSSIFSLGAIVSGIVHIRRVSENVTENASSAGAYLEATYHSTLGHQPLSIVYAFPLAATLWGVATFSIGLLCRAYESYNGTFASELVGVGILAAVMLLSTISSALAGEA